MSTKIKLSLSEKLRALSALLEYPREDFIVKLDAAAEAVHDNQQACLLLSQFRSEINKLQLHEVEELYTRTFDLAPICIPYVSSHIYGDENFERGALMSGLAQQYEDCKFSTNGELPDHVAIILRFAPNFSEEELQDLMEFCLIQALQRMHEALKEAENPYQHILHTVLLITESERRGKIL